MKISIYTFILSTCLTIAATHTTYGQAGTLDLTFGTGGIVTTDINAGERGQSVAMQSDGKMVVAGFSSNGAVNDFALVRYNSDGSLDNTFGSNGKVTTDMDGYNDFALSVAIQSDGKIVAAGGSETNGYDADFAVARYNNDGTLDTTFSSDGKVITDLGDFDDEGWSVAIQTDGKIVVAGFSGNGYDYYFALARYNSDGSLDSTFSTDGLVTTDLGYQQSSGYSVAIQNDGKIVVAGTGNDGNYNNFALARYNSDGTLDTTFSSDGKVTASFGTLSDGGTALAIQSDGKLVEAGHSFNGFNHIFALVRYNTNGTLDSTFGNDGKVSTYFGNSSVETYSVAIQSDGKIVVAGESDGFALVRYNSDGSLDYTFGTNGEVSTIIGTNSGGYSVAIQSDSKIVVAGYTVTAGNYNFAVARYNADFGLGITENSGEENTIAISPNPFTTEFVVTGTTATGELILFDILGKEILQQSHLGGTSMTRINTENLLPGFYFLSYIEGNKSENIKVVKF